MDAVGAASQRAAVAERSQITETKKRSSRNGIFKNTRQRSGDCLQAGSLHYGKLQVNENATELERLRKEAK